MAILYLYVCFEEHLYVHMLMPDNIVLKFKTCNLNSSLRDFNVFTATFLESQLCQYLHWINLCIALHMGDS